MAVICPLVEGYVDDAVASRLLEFTGHQMGTVYGLKGSGYIRRTVGGFNRAAKGINYLTLIDLMDSGIACAPDVVRDWVPHRKRGMIFRVVVREIESWILADRFGIAAFLSVAEHRVPLNPENEPDPKLALVNLARRSRRKTLKNAIIPENGMSGVTGRLYTTEVRRFVFDHWSVPNAMMNAPSLRKCVERLQAF